MSPVSEKRSSGPWQDRKLSWTRPELLVPISVCIQGINRKALYAEAVAEARSAHLAFAASDNFRYGIRGKIVVKTLFVQSRSTLRGSGGGSNVETSLPWPLQVLINARHRDRVVRWPGAAINFERTLSPLRCLGELLIKWPDKLPATNR